MGKCKCPCTQCILEAPVTEETSDEKKKNHEKVCTALRYISELKKCEKLRVRPLPMYIESLIEYYLKTDIAKAREEEEKIGAILVNVLTAEIAATKTDPATTPLPPYCRVCECVYSTFNVFYKHIQSSAHKEMKMDDSVPRFDEDETLTKNQVVAREFLGPALHDREMEEFESDEEDEDEDEKESTDEEDEDDCESRNGDSSDSCCTADFESAEENKLTDSEDTVPLSSFLTAPSTPFTPPLLTCSSSPAATSPPAAPAHTVDDDPAPPTAATGSPTATSPPAPQGADQKKKYSDREIQFAKHVLDLDAQINPQKYKNETEEEKKKGAKEEHPSGGIPEEKKVEEEKSEEGVEKIEEEEQPSGGIPEEMKVDEKEMSDGGLDKEIEKEQELKGAILGSLEPKEIVEYRLKKRPCDVCSRIWSEYRQLLVGHACISMEFAFRSHPLHPCVTLLYLVLENFKQHGLEIENDEATRPSSTRPVKFPSKEQLKELSQELYDEIEGKAPARQSSLYNPLCQMICFIDAVILLKRKEQKEIEKKVEIVKGSGFVHKKERKSTPAEVKEEKKLHMSSPAEAKEEHEEQMSSPAKVKKEKEDEGKEEIKQESKKEGPLIVVDVREDSPFVMDKRGFLVYRMGHHKVLAAQKKEIRVIRRERTESEKTDGEIVYVI